MKKLLSFPVLIIMLLTNSSYAMTLREKVGQLFVIRPDQLQTTLTLEQIHNDRLKDSKIGVKSVSRLMLENLKKYPAGGFVIFRKNIESEKQLRSLTSSLINASKIYPIMAIDEEGGKISRIANSSISKNIKKFKSSQEISSKNQTRQAAEYIASYIKDYGFNMNFAPVADINTNPENIVIGDRAYGNNPEIVSHNVSEYLDGLHSQNILGCIKHFPGHGDTKGDTHSGFVAVTKTWPELLKTELIPFIENFEKTDSVMIAHITMKNITHDNLPATLSKELITGKLRNELGYDGVVIADAMNMGAIKDNYSSSEAALLALEAGCDILLMPYDYIEAFNAVLEAVESGRISESRLDESVNRIMKLKEKQKMKWWQKAIIYQIYPKSFQDTNNSGTGDIKGITKRLDYLADLGVGALWLCPVYPSPNVDNGYDISDYTAINPSFGTMNDFDELISEANKRNIKIVMDLVFNHCSDKHEWFIESKKSRDNPKSDWFIWRDPKSDGSVPTNWRSIFGGSAWTYCEERKQYYLHTFAKEQPDLNWENENVRKALYDAANFWLDKGVGGFRIDAITYIKKPKEFIDGKPDSNEGSVNIHLMTANQPGILDFLREFKQKVFDGHDIFTVGEANGVKAEELHNWVGNKGVFDMLFEFSHVDLPLNESEIWCHPRKWKLSELKHALSSSQYATKNNGWCPVFFENHDQPRSVNHFFSEGVNLKKAAKVLASVLFTMRGTPFIYQGQELGMTNNFWHDIKEIDDVQTKGQYNLALSEGFSEQEAMKFIRYFTRDNARTPMHWNNTKNAGFSNAETWLPVNENYIDINAENEKNDSDSVLNWYKKLIALRKNHDVLIYGDYHEIYSDDEKIFCFVREHDGRKIITLANFSNEYIKIPDDLLNLKIIMSSENDFDFHELKPLEARIYEN